MEITKVTRVFTVEGAARIHRVPLEEFVGILRRVVARQRRSAP